MENDLKSLLEKVVLNDATKEAITEAWTKKVEQVKESVEETLRGEYAERFEHDKATIVSALDSFITDKISAEIEKVKTTKAELDAKKVELESTGKEMIEKFEAFLAQKLEAELKEFADERVTVTESVKKTERFIVKKLSEEIEEYNEGKLKLAEERLSLETEKKQAIMEAKTNFIKRASAIAEKSITESLRNELTELRHDIMEARNNDMGKKIFETYASEFKKHFFNESTEVKTISSKINQLEQQLMEAKHAVEEKNKQLMESKKTINTINESVQRKEVMGELLQSISAEKRPMMNKLLESVKTENLKESYKKFLPSVLGLNSSNIVGKTKLTESNSITNTLKTVDGNRTVKNTIEINEEEFAAIEQLKSLTRRTF